MRRALFVAAVALSVLTAMTIAVVPVGGQAPPPNIDGSVADGSIWVSNWGEGTDVTVQVRDMPGGTVLRERTITTGGDEGNGSADFNIDLEAGMEITATDGTTTKRLVLLDLEFTDLDLANDVVRGTGPDTTTELSVWVGDHDVPGSECQVRVSLVGGTWELQADLACGADLVATSWSAVALDDGDGDANSASWHRPMCDDKEATYWGTSGDDVIAGTAGADVIHGMGGSDTINGRSGNDTLCGGNGHDTLIGGKGRDTIYGQKGRDTISGGAKADTIEGNGGADTIEGNGGADNIKGGAKADTIEGNKGNDRIRGGAGDDSCDGGPGADNVKGC